MNFAKADLRTIHTSLVRLLPPGARPPTAEEIVEINRVREVVEAAIRESRTVLERGVKVFEWRVPREQALTLNQYAHMKGWQKKKMRVALDDTIRKLLPFFPAADLNGAKIRRWVRATRFSTQRVDDLALDCLGAKMPLDALVRCGILADDTNELIHREPCWQKTPRGNTHLLMEVFSMSVEGVTAPDPVDASQTQLVRKPGPLTQAILDGK